MRHSDPEDTSLFVVSSPQAFVRRYLETVSSAEHQFCLFSQSPPPYYRSSLPCPSRCMRTEHPERETKKGPRRRGVVVPNERSIRTVTFCFDHEQQ